MPRFSVVVPTRDRPDFLDFCLESLASQTFPDFEVVVSDNAVERPARAVFDKWAGPGWRYVKPEQPVPMHDNFELACGQAGGELVAVVIDKTVLHRSALEVANAALEAEPAADIVTWRNEGYTPIDEERGLEGTYRPEARTAAPALYDPAAELARRFANDDRRGDDPVHYVRGKIVFGAYSSGLLDRIRGWTGRVFHPLAPDYTSMVPASVLSKGAVDVGRPLLLSCISASSNGRLASIHPAYARRFIEQTDPGIVDRLPIPDLYTAQHNVVAYDLVSSAGRCPPGAVPALDYPNLLRRCREDLSHVVWTDPAERAAQFAILEAAEARYGVTLHETAPRPSLRARIARVPAVRRLRHPEPRRYASPVEAVRAADGHYAA
jgi:cellulose synthase/poly-beta-1,6-N-acetylglucosamine synthase-like glycosyltransferase